jgi:hypothetical protein
VIHGIAVRTPVSYHIREKQKQYHRARAVIEWKTALTSSKLSASSALKFAGTCVAIAIFSYWRKLSLVGNNEVTREAHWRKKA